MAVAARVGLFSTRPFAHAPIAGALRTQGYAVVVLDSSETARAAAADHAVDILVLVDGSGESGAAAACREIRACEATRAIPLLVITGRSEESAMRIAVLTAGADDAIAWGSGLRELQARIVALLRRTMRRWELDGRYADEHIVVDAATRRVTNGRGRVQLTCEQFEVLWLLLRESPALVTAERIELTGAVEAGSAARVRGIIRELRRKLGRNLVQIHRGWGYRYEPVRDCLSTKTGG